MARGIRRAGEEHRIAQSLLMQLQLSPLPAVWCLLIPSLVAVEEPASLPPPPSGNPGATVLGHPDGFRQRRYGLCWWRRRKFRSHHIFFLRGTTTPLDTQTVGREEERLNDGEAVAVAGRSGDRGQDRGGGGGGGSTAILDNGTLINYAAGGAGAQGSGYGAAGGGTNTGGSAASGCVGNGTAGSLHAGGAGAGSIGGGGGSGSTGGSSASGHGGGGGGYGASGGAITNAGSSSACCVYGGAPGFGGSTTGAATSNAIGGNGGFAVIGYSATSAISNPAIEPFCFST